MGCREDLTEASGLFAQVLKECKIDTFNTAIKWEEKADYQVWFSLHLSYSHFDGGSNGMGIADFCFDGKEWSKCRFKGGNAEFIGSQFSMRRFRF